MKMSPKGIIPASIAVKEVEFGEREFERSIRTDPARWYNGRNDGDPVTQNALVDEMHLKKLQNCVHPQIPTDIHMQ